MPFDGKKESSNGFIIFLWCGIITMKDFVKIRQKILILNQMVVLSVELNQIGEFGFIDLIKKDTRHFAKRQLTWFRREKEVVWLNKKEYEQEKNLLDSVLNIIKEKGICNGTKR